MKQRSRRKQMGAIALDFSAITASMPQPTHPQTASGFAGFAKRAWLLMYAEGGRWTATEIRQRFALSRAVREVSSSLGEMARDGFLVRHRVTNVDGETKVSYSVTASCKVPRGVVIAEIQELLDLADMARGRR